MVLAVAAAAAGAACDIRNTQHDQKTRGPANSVLGTNVEGTGARIPANGVLQIAFDRYLLPATITRQSYAVLDGNGGVVVETKSIYDPVARIVTIFGPAGIGKRWLEPNQPYKLVLPVPADDTNLGGYRAIDRATLAAPLEYAFFAGPETATPYAEPAVDFCADVLPLFRMKCGGTTCHGASDAATARSSLVLDSGDAVRATAIDRVAQGANTSHALGLIQSEPRLFGVDMALIKPENPGASWLVYKIELAPHPKVDAGPAPAHACAGDVDGPVPPPLATPYAPLVRFRPEADDLERSILSDHVLGREMPFPQPARAYVVDPPTCGNPTPTRYHLTPLAFDERERIRLWIAQGANVRACGECREPDPPAPPFTLPDGTECPARD